MSVKNQQLSVLSKLLSKGSATRFGRAHYFRKIGSYPEFRQAVPIGFYKDFEEDVERLKEGGTDLLWPGKIDEFAVSAGTSGSGKHLPLTSDRLRSDRRFMRKLLFSYLKQRPNPLRLMGMHLSIPGSVEEREGIRIGEISGFTASEVPWWMRTFQLQDPAELARLGFEAKFERILNTALETDIKAIVAVPSWILTLFQQALAKSGESSVAALWPNLRLLVCGGVKLMHYRKHLEKLAAPLQPDFIETYGASEGYFAFTDDLKHDDLGLVFDNGIFYEFVPDPLPRLDSLSIQPAVPLWEARPGIPYALIVTTNAGLWRFAVNDIVEFTSVDPPRIRVKGRLEEMLDDFGEGLYLYEAEKVLKEIARRENIDMGDFTVGAHLASEHELPRHHWFVQFFEPIHTDTLNRIAGQIDRGLRQINRHYAIRRESGALASPTVYSINQDEINRWLDFREKRKAQGKLPGILHSRKDVEFFLDK